jgi:hypothetical protein
MNIIISMLVVVKLSQPDRLLLMPCFVFLSEPRDGTVCTSVARCMVAPRPKTCDSYESNLLAQSYRKRQALHHRQKTC